jgi:uncharacterized Fe-S center protein
MSRREVVRLGTGLAVARMLGLTGFAGAKERAATRVEPARDQGAMSRVVLIRNEGALDSRGQPVGDVLHAMLNEAVTTLLEAPSPEAAWGRLVGPSDVVGIKSNVWNPIRTPRGLEEAIRREVRRVGVAESDVSVDDRGVLRNPVFARATALINVRPMRTHAWSGLGTCLKNVIMFAPRPPDYHDDACASLGALWRLPLVADKVRLNILVMLTPQFHSVGPHSFSEEYVWPYCGLIVGTDPVAVDATGARIVQLRRNLYFGEERPISPPPHHIVYADTRYGLGVSDPARIEIVRLGWSDGAQI